MGNVLAHRRWASWWRKEGEVSLRRVLMESWDPIGVADVPEAADECDSYVLVLGGKLKGGASVDEVAAYLAFVRTEVIGLSPNRAVDRAAAERAVAWYTSAMK